MTETIRINAGKGYDVKIGPGLLQKAGDLAAETLRGKKAALFTDSVVAGCMRISWKKVSDKRGLKHAALSFPRERTDKICRQQRRLWILCQNII